MNLVDSCGWLEYFTDGSYADFYSFPLRKLDQLIVPTICIYEVFKKIAHEKDDSSALQAVATMKQGQVIDLDTNIAMSAAKISYDLKIPMADSIILATSKMFKALIWTQDEHFKNISNVKFQIKKAK